MTYGKSRWLAGMAFIAIAVHAPAQTAEDAAWSKVAAAQREGFRLRDQELQASGDARGRLNVLRVEAFRRADAELQTFIRSFLTDTASVRYLIATYQLAYDSEFGGWDVRALTLYNFCREHAMLRDRAAVFGAPPEPIATTVPLRIEAVLKRLNAGSVPSTSAHNQLGFQRYSGKGGIDLNGITPPRPLSAEEAFRVTQRLSFPDDIDRARVEWRHLLEQRPELEPVVEDNSAAGMLVFGLKGTAGSARQVASLLDSSRRDLMRRYFDSGLPSPTMVVLANLTAFGPPVPAATPRAQTRDAAPQLTNAAQLMNAAQLTNAPANAVSVSPVDVRQQQIQVPQQQQQQVQQQQVQQQQVQQQQVQQQIQRPMEQRSAGGGQSGGQSAGPEDIGRILSATVHFRDMADMEGYYESLDHSLVLRKNLVNDRGEMFLGTGLHELVHGLIQVDYPEAPMWLNEGMAALHEEYGPNEPHDNYRLYVARAAMTSGRWLSLGELLEPNPAWWDSEARPVMMAAARYFCIFLWKEGRLPAVYRAMRQAQTTTGAVSAPEVLQRVTGMSVADLETRWRSDLESRNLSSLDARWGELREPIQRYTQRIRPFAGVR